MPKWRRSGEIAGIVIICVSFFSIANGIGFLLFTRDFPKKTCQNNVIKELKADNVEIA